jgi:transposase
MSGKEFAKWMDEAGMNLASAAAHFGVSEQTIYNWRSTRGVADSKVNWVVSRMREFLASKGEKELPDRLTLEVSREQFDGWSHAALADGKILRDWALHTLDEAAAEHTELSQSQDPLYPPLSRVAEEGNEYRAAADAKPGPSSPPYEDEGAA